jgi:hypothetical protein
LGPNKVDNIQDVIVLIAWKICRKW